MSLSEAQVQDTLRKLVDPNTGKDFVATRSARNIKVSGSDGYETPDLRGLCVILVDDGLATGATMRAAARAVRQREPSEVVVAVPVAAESSCLEMREEADAVICARTPEPFYGVGQFYRRFSQTSDEEVRELLQRAAAEREASKS